MSNPKALFQIDNGAGWETVAEADIIDGVAQAPNVWTMARVMRKQIVYTGYVQEVISVPPDDNPRDTHFTGFAKALWSEMLQANDYGYIDCNEHDDPTDTPNYIEVIARRAYDLVLHTCWRTIPASGSTIKKYSGMTIEEIANMIPDMSELPKGQQRDNDKAKEEK